MPFRVSFVNLQKLTFHGVGRKSQHVDIGAGAENAVLGAGDHDRADFRMLEPNSLQGIVQLDIHAQVVGIQLQFIAGTQTRLFR